MVQAARPRGVGGCSQTKVSGIVTEKYAEPSRAVFSDSATGDYAVQRDRLAVTTLQTEQARTIAASISTRQVAYLKPLHPDRHRVRVVGIVVLGNQHGIDGWRTRSSGQRGPTSRQRLSW